jgi:regulator of sirC expression with transglutaminase-like and TPR domain
MDILETELVDHGVDEAFRRIVTGPDEEINLAEAALQIARGEYPGLDIGFYLNRLDVMADEIRAQLPDRDAIPQLLGQINHYLFKQQGFAGNLGDFLDPRNSFLNDVIDRKLGIPISLSVLYMEIGRRLGLPIEGVAFPGHFLVKLRTVDGEIVLDPFAGGLSLDEEDLQQRLKHLAEAGFTGPADLATLLVAASNRAILLRMLRNLKSIYVNQKDHTRALRTLNHILLLAPDEAREIRDRAGVYENLLCYRAAHADYLRFLALAPYHEDAETVRLRCEQLRYKLERLH